MNRLSRLLLGFSVAFAVLIILPAFLGQPFFLYPLMKRGDALDLFTPLILLPLYYLLLVRAAGRAPSVREMVVFLVLGALWVEGQGMHLAANSIGHHLRIADDAAALSYWYDEHLSHYMWHAALLGLSIMIVLREGVVGPYDEPENGAGGPPQWGWVVLSAAIYGVTFFIVTIEGNTAWLGIPTALALVVLLWRARRGLSARPLLAFFGIGYAVALIFFAGWAIYWNGLPQFSEVGII